MTPEEMLARLRTLLDETPEGFWDDETDCYPALSDGQLEVIKLLAAKNSPVLDSLVIPVARTGLALTPANEIPLPDDFFVEYSIKAHPTGGIEKPCTKRRGNNYKYQDNPYLTSEEDELYYSVYSNKLVFEIDFVNGSVTFDYVPRPKNIDADNAATINVAAHTAIVYYAWAILLNKAKLDSGAAFKIFYQTVGAL